MKHILIGISVLILSSTVDKDIDYDSCTPASDKALRTVEFFMQNPDLADFRKETGTQGLTTSQIGHVSNPIICGRLKDLVDANSGLQKNKEGYTMYFYKAGNFYFITHIFNGIRLGYTDFNVISNDFKILAMYGI